MDFQKEEVIEALGKDGATLDTKHIFVDDGYTGINGNRPALNALKEMAQNKEFDIVYVWKIDRLFRNTKLVLSLVDDWAKLDVSVKSILEPFCDSSTPIGRYMFTILAAGAEMEHASINERTYHGKVRAMREGKWLCGTPTYGYDLVDGRLQVNKEEAKWVKKFYEWFVNGRMTLYQLQQRVNSLGIPTKHANLGRNTKITSKTFWNKGVLGRILSNETYTGNFYYRKYKYLSRMNRDTELRPREEWIVIHPPAIVSDELHQLSRKQLQENQENSRRNTMRLYMFAKKLTCGVCRHKVNAAFRNPTRGTNQNGTRYYRGAWVSKHCTDQVCRNCYFYAEPRLDRAVWGGLMALLSDPERVMRKIEQHRNKTIGAQNVSEEQARILAQEKAVEDKEAKLLNTYLEGDIDKQVYKKKLLELTQEKEATGEQIRRFSQLLLNKEERARRIGSVKALYAKMRDKLDSASYEMRCRVINLFVENVTLTGNNAEAELYIPLQGALSGFVPQLNQAIAGNRPVEVLRDRRGMDRVAQQSKRAREPRGLAFERQGRADRYCF